MLAARIMLFREGKTPVGGGAGLREIFVILSRFTAELLHAENSPFMKIRVKIYLNVHGVSQVGDWEEKNNHADKYKILGLGL